MHLKTKFGDGYAIVAVSNNAASAQPLGEALGHEFTGATLVQSIDGDNGENLASYALTRTATEAEVLRAVETIESERLAFGVRDYSINSATLGEVFTSITSLKEDVVEEGDDHKQSQQQ